MPTPIGHALGGFIVWLAVGPRGTGPRGTVPERDREICAQEMKQIGPKIPRTTARRWGTVPARDLSFCAVAACLPDLDFLWGRHNMETHSLGFAVLVGLAVCAWRRDVRIAVTCVLAVASHVLFDWLGSDDSPPLGVMALWPLTHAYYFANAFVFDAISRRYWLPGFVQHNLFAVVREMAILLPIAGALWMWRRPRR